MTAEREFDRRLAAWFDEWSSSTVPDGLLERSMARVARIRQRPTLLTPGAYAGPWLGRRRAPIAAPVLVALLVILVVIVALAGAQLLIPRLVVVAPTPTPTAVEDSSPQPSLEPVATPLDTRPPAFTAGARTFATANEIAPFGDAVAWVETEEAILRTEDAGLTWREVQPAGWVNPFDEAFVDANTAYVPIAGTPTVAVTHDGGASWATTRLDPGVRVETAVYAFSDADHGYVTFVDEALYDAPEGTGIIVFATADGGATWVGPVRGTQPHLPGEFNKVYPAHGAILVESAGKFDGKPFQNDFYMSADGGMHWTTYTFPINAISPKNNTKEVGDILVEPNGRILTQFSAYPNGPGVHPNGIYESTDDPATWRLLYTEPVGGWDVQFLSATTWILRSGAPSELMTTTNAAATWSTVTPATSLYYASPPVFGSLTTAWYTIDCRWLDRPGCEGLVHDLSLFVSTDGGRIWREVGG